MLIQSLRVAEVQEALLAGLKVQHFEAFVIVECEPRQEYAPKKIEIAIRQEDTCVRIVTSLENGWPYLEHLIRVHRWSAVSVRYIEDAVIEWIVWRLGTRIRYVRALKEERWHWFTIGAPLPFEDVQKYRRRKIVERFEMSDVNSYLEHLGYTKKRLTSR